MVIYHSLNYSADYTLGFKYLAFLPPSFILITGFLVSSIYLSRPDVRAAELYRRLFLRGAKLLLLFTILNLVGQSLRRYDLAGQPTGGLSRFLNSLFEVYVLGDGRLVVFEVLIPIAYLLIFAPIFIGLDRLHQFALPAVTLLIVTLLAWWEQHGGSSSNAHFLSAGMLGLVLGRLSFKQLNLLGRFWPLTILAYAGYFALSAWRGHDYLIQMLGAVVALALIYALAVKAGAGGWWQRRLEVLGQYSLLAYIAQIGLLQVLSRLAGRPEPVSIRFLGLFLAALVLTALIVEFVAWAREKSTAINGTYRAVFA